MPSHVNSIIYFLLLDPPRTRPTLACRKVLGYPKEIV